MTTPSAKFVTAADVARVIDLDTRPERWHAGPPFELLDIHPGRVVLIGAPPGAGKSTLALQLVTGVLANTPNLRAIIGNCEMPAGALVEKLLARFASVDYCALQDRELLSAERARVDAARQERAALLDRIAFLGPPFTLRNLGEALQGFHARFAIVDYAQRFTTGEGDDRAKLDALMNGVRVLANAGAGVVLISSVARQKSRNGSSTYAGLNLASFRGSSELEFGCDAAFVLDSDLASGVAVLKCEKNRFRPPRDIHLRFDGARQTFTAGDPLDLYDAAPELKTGENK